MKVRAIAGVLPFLALALLVQPLAAQGNEDHEWTRNRPDALGPAHLSGDFTLRPWELNVGVKFLNQRMEGQGVGSDSLTVDQVLASFAIAPTELVTQGAEVDLVLGVTDHLSVSARGVFAAKTMNQWTQDPDNPSTVWITETKTSGLQDVRLSALYSFFDQGAIRAHVQGGISVPVGGTDATDQVLDPGNPGGGIVEVQLPYQQQLGSGTFDALPGFTLTIQNPVASLGVHGQAVIRMGENDRGWSLGDVYRGTVWGAYKASDHVSVFAGGRFSQWGNVEGFDQALTTADVYDSPAYNSLQEGWAAEIPVGMNILMPEGRFQGHRLALEVVFPVHQSLDWVQFRQDWGLVVGWKKSFQF